MAAGDGMRRDGKTSPVSRNRRSLEHALAGVAFGALARGSPAGAADQPRNAP
jgi:high affinity Mn2+ porin